MKGTSYSFLTLALFFSCTSPADQEGTYTPEDLDRRELLRYQQYLVEGKKLYKLYCENCHQADGKGLAKLYPPLAGSDYLKENIDQLPCIILGGMDGEITVNAITFNMKMDGNPTLNPLEIAEITNYVANSWGNESGFLNVQKIQTRLDACAP